MKIKKSEIKKLIKEIILETFDIENDDRVEHSPENLPQWYNTAFNRKEIRNKNFHSMFYVNPKTGKSINRWSDREFKDWQKLKRRTHRPLSYIPDDNSETPSSINESSDFSEAYEGYDIELDNITIPDISSPNDSINIIVNVNYNLISGHEATGMFSAPEHSEAESGNSIEIVNIVPVVVKVNGNEFTVKNLSVEQVSIIKKAVGDYLLHNESKIEETILNSLE